MLVKAIYAAVRVYLEQDTLAFQPWVSLRKYSVDTPYQPYTKVSYIWYGVVGGSVVGWRGTSIVAGKICGVLPPRWNMMSLSCSAFFSFFFAGIRGTTAYLLLTCCTGRLFGRCIVWGNFPNRWHDSSNRAPPWMSTNRPASNISSLNWEHIVWVSKPLATIYHWTKKQMISHVLSNSLGQHEMSTCLIFSMKRQIF